MSQLDYLMAYWNIPRVITYQTPPYITVRIKIGLHPGPLFPRPRLLLDMKRKFSSAKGGRYYISNKEEGGEESLTPNEVYTKGTSQISQIHDDGYKWIFFNAPSILKASPKQNSDNAGVAKFEITSYREKSNPDILAVTLKIDGTNLYLACNNGKLTLENNNENLNTIQDSTKKFLFLRPRSIQSVTFESAVNQGMFLCTNKISQTSPVNMSNFSDPQKIVSFTIDKEVGISFVRVGNNRFSLQEPKEILKSFEENDQLMANSYERFTYRPYGIHFHVYRQICEE